MKRNFWIFVLLWCTVFVSRFAAGESSSYDKRDYIKELLLRVHGTVQGDTVFPRAGTIISHRTGTQSEGLIRTGGGVGERQSSHKECQDYSGLKPV